MPRYCITLIEYQTLLDTTDVYVEAETPKAAARVALDGVSDETETNGERHVSLPDGQCGVLDPDEVAECEIVAEVRDHPAGGILGRFGPSRMLDLSLTECREVLAVLAAIADGTFSEARHSACQRLHAQLSELAS